MRIVFMGTPDFAVPPLEALADAGHDIVGVFTQPDKPNGRKMKQHRKTVDAVAASLLLEGYLASLAR